jgi:1-acyl-sn-glycerol-3-phosphate acyltransferase
MPDVELKPQVYRDPRPEEYFAQFHERARRGDAGWTYEAVRLFVVPYMLALFRIQGVGAENVPDGPVILAPNHGSFMDHFFAGSYVRRRVRFMAKSQLFNNPVANFIFSHGGVFPVRRGHQDEEAFTTAFRLLDLGNAIVMYCEGGRSRTGSMAAEAKPGIGRLALQSGAPVVPIAISGSQKVRNWKRLQFPKVLVRYGEPVRFEQIDEPTREQQQDVADYILDRIRELHTQLVGEGFQASLADHRRRQAAREAPQKTPEPVA